MKDKRGRGGGGGGGSGCTPLLSDGLQRKSPPPQEGSGRLGGPQPAPLADVHFRAPRPTLGDKRGTIGIRARHWQKRTSEPAAGAGRPDALPGSGRAEGDLLRLCGDRGRAADAGGGRGEQRPGSRAAAVLGSCALWSLGTRLPAVWALGMWADLWSWAPSAPSTEKKYSEDIRTLFNRPQRRLGHPTACGMASNDDFLLVDNRWATQIDVIDPGGPHAYR